MSPATEDHAPFRAFEAAGWAARADAYHRFFFFSPISARLIGPLLDAAHVGPHTRVLDLASGPLATDTAGALLDGRVMADPLAAGNVLNPAFTTVGIGAVYVNGVMWVAEDFSG